MKNSLPKKRIGVVAPLSSLWSKYPGASMFQLACLFIDWIHKQDMNVWQLLPLYETQLETGSLVRHVPSPYKGYGIGFTPSLLQKNSKHPSHIELKTFVHQNRTWIGDYALFCALRDEFGTDNWALWPSPYRDRDIAALASKQKRWKKTIEKYMIEQCQLHQSYLELRMYAKNRGVELAGDMPFYIPLASPLTWMYQRAFVIDKQGKLPRVSGVPNGPKAHFGRQVWGHPLYNWQASETIPDIMKLFRLRINYLGQLFSILRIDHAKGFFHYGAIDPYHSWKDEILLGPGAPALKEICSAVYQKNIFIFAEDSGDGACELRETLEKIHVPGIRIFRFAIDEKIKKFNPLYANISTYPKHVVACTTTHDTQTLMGYLALLSVSQKRKLSEHARVRYDPSDRIFAMELRGAIVSSPAQTVLFPIQDLLLTTTRMNIPGTEKEHGDTNWQYQLECPVEDLPNVIL